MAKAFPGAPLTKKPEGTRGAFEYPPLPDAGSGSLRLIQIESGQGLGSQDGIYCTMICTQSWRKNMKYDCLSYCWGEGGKKRQIFVRTSDGPDSHYQPFLVTENLLSALTSLQETHAAKWLWIDAISINQGDLAERSAQVAMMKEIYSRAASVIIWLGECTATLNKASSIISSIAIRFRDDTTRTAESIIGNGSLALSTSDIGWMEQYTSRQLPEAAVRESYECVANFFSLQWFRRVWVLQEAFSNKKITARLGQLSLPWGSILLAALWQSFLTRRYTTYLGRAEDDGGHQGAGYLPELWFGLLHNRAPRGLSMVELVCRARDFQASDPRDKCFALLGLANDITSPNSQTPNMRPDYSKSKVDVYTGFAREMILMMDNLDILSAVDTFSVGRPQNDIISWMPDFDVCIATIRGLGFPRKYNAAFSTAVDHSTVTNNSPGSTALSLSGFIIDQVGPQMTSVLTMGKDLNLHADTEDALMTIWEKHLCSHRQGSAEDAVLQSYIHTLTAAGFALYTDFRAYPLGKVVPSREVPSLVADFAAYFARIDPAFASLRNASHLRRLVERGDPDQFAVLAGKACHERKFFITRDGRMGLCPRNARPGDAIAILYGGSVPYVLRELGEGKWYFVGECYVDGMMFGEAEELKRTRGIQDQVFNIA
ncbi:hypothetical protein BU26DRAFT_415845 [Trematosphaeria pertusa]|uniref:Heterokaryon incompatibility domain-containing protein n=1 Tax=Trematosphaeria pertusa TaxID=390896 RepID=A0A6A6IWM4_9PLEO|nr:uncharacterized protein BU26DRAFT_415845 [Trematosphaeria pertusa]KAF2254955.1 hypothetical protein BU26DRAFT_415845 [Trematosphaeria pertusa]